MQNDKEKFKKDFKRRLYNLTLNTIKFIDKLSKDNVSRRIGDQLLRSVTSIIGNYVEGQAASSKKDFTIYFNISLKSANESKLWFSILKDTGRAGKEEVEKYLTELDEISKIFGSSILTLKNKR
jgi:four helix bundle protein